MDRQGAVAALQHYIDHSGAGDEDRASEIYHEDAVLEFPQSGERFEGVQNFREWRRSYPGSVELQIVRMRGGDDVWVAEVRGRYDGGPWIHGVSILQFRGDKVARETIYVAEAWEAPEWRAPWRAAPPREGVATRG
jgi:ketosteroid isomerase-like protein